MYSKGASLNRGAPFAVRDSDPVLQFQDVSFTYEPSNPSAFDLKGIDFHVRPGGIVVVMGESGSGKSTLARLACSLLHPVSGEIVAQSPAYVAQNPEYNMIGETVYEDVAVGLTSGNSPNLATDQPIRDRVQWSLRVVGMDGTENRRIASLSGGEIQRVALAGALAAGRSLIVLDEPTTHLSTTDSVRFWTALKQMVDRRDVGIVLVTHNPLEALIGNRVIVLGGGQMMIDGPPKIVFRNPELVDLIGLRPEVVEGVAGIIEKYGRTMDFPAIIDEVVDNICLR